VCVCGLGILSSKLVFVRFSSFSLVGNLARLNWLSRYLYSSCSTAQSILLYKVFVLYLFAVWNGSQVLHSIVGHAVTGICLYVILQETLAGYHTGLRMMTGTAVTFGALAQGVDVDLVEELLTFSHCEQLARLLPLTAKALNEIKTNVIAKFSRENSL